MTDKGEYYKTEKTIGDAFREDATRTAPPFAGIAERIAAGEPCESFGEFFAGEVIPLRQTASQKGGFWSTNRKTIAAAAAAALILFIGGGAVLGAVFSGSVMDSKTAAETFGLPDNMKPVMLLGLGYPNERAKPSAWHFQKNPVEDFVTEL